MIQKIFNDFMNYNFDKTISSKIALSVSGGSDSTALLFLASTWAKANFIKLIIFSIDHKLRKESLSELEFVQSVTSNLNHQFIPFVWSNATSKKRIQEKSRIDRYNMMTKKCYELNIKCLLTGHHYDDFLENYLMRKKRKSGILGLSNSYSNFYNNIQILRPLFNLKKSMLIRYLRMNSIYWMEDKSNLVDLYERNKVRKYISLLSNKDKNSLENEANNLDLEAKNFNKRLIIEIAKSVEFSELGFAFIDISLLKKINYVLAIYIISYALTSINGNIKTPRHRSIRKLLNIVYAKDSFTHSLHRCIAYKNINSRLLIIFREKNVICNRNVSLNHKIVWDSRFKFLVSDDLNKEKLQVGKLTIEEYTKIKTKIDLTNLAKLSQNNHKDILFTLPIIKDFEKVVAIPHISYYDGFKPDSRVNIIFSPAFVSRFTHFL